MKVLLIQPPHYYDGGSRPPTNFLLGLGYIARVLHNAGHQVDVLDIWAHQWTNQEVIHNIQNIDHDIIGISAFSTQYAYVKWLIAELRKYSKAKIAVGGALATFSAEIVLKHTQAEICVIGDGELTFLEALKNLDNLKTVEGIYFKQNGEIIKNSPRKYIQNLDNIEFPDWDLFPIEIYLKNCAVFGYPNIKAMNIVTSRGCPWDCRFCSKTFSGVRLRSIDNVIDEIKELKRRYDIRGIAFNDELVLINKQRAYELCEKIEPLQIKWSCQGRVNNVDLDLLKRMKKAGCLSVGYGVESGSQTILDGMNKKTTVAQAHTALRDTVKAGLIPIVQMMYGYPGETRETLQETIDFFKNVVFLGPEIINSLRLSATIPLPGAELYERAVKDGLISNEEKFLEELSAGYMHNVQKLLVNFTDFSKDEFWRLKNDTERMIKNEQVKRHPVRFLIGLLLLRLKQIVPYYKKWGLKATIKTVTKKLFPLKKVIQS